MITQAQADLVRATARAAFFGALSESPGNMAHTLVSTTYPSTADQETYPWIGQVPQLQKWEGLRGIKGLPTQKYTLPNIKWEATIAVEGELARREKLGQVTVRSRDLARRAQWHRERLFIDRLLEGRSGGTGLAYDGQNYFDNDHKDAGAVYTTNQSNVSSKTVAVVASPTVVEMEAAVDAALVQIRKLVDDQGEPWNLSERWVIVVPPAYQKPATLVFGSPGTVTTNAADATGATGAFRGLGDVIVSTYLPARQTALGLTVDNKMYLFNVAPEVKPIILQTEVEPDFQELGPGSEHTFKTDTLLYGIWASYNIGYGPWQYAHEITFSL